MSKGPPKIGVRDFTAADAEAVQRLARRVGGPVPSARVLKKFMLLHGRKGFMAGHGVEAPVGYLLATVDAPTVLVEYVGAVEPYRERALAALTTTLTDFFPAFEVVFHVPDENYELLAALKDAAGELTPVPSDDRKPPTRFRLAPRGGRRHDRPPVPQVPEGD